MARGGASALRDEEQLLEKGFSGSAGGVSRRSWSFVEEVSGFVGSLGRHRDGVGGAGAGNGGHVARY